MKTLGIIVEYNPFHYGHELHIRKSIEQTKADYVIAIMSGNYTQRGEFAIYDKFTRAQCAVEMGVNLVIELPLIYAISSAEDFCYGAVRILNALGIVDYIVFGSEELDVEKARELYERTKAASYSEHLKTYIDQGNSYAKAQELALGYKLRSNEILALNYVKSIDRLHSNIELMSIKREQSSYLSDDTEGRISSAKSIRNRILSGEDYAYYVPQKVYNIIKKHHAVSNRDALDMFIYSIIHNDNSNIYMANEGLENLLVKAATSSNTYDELLDALVSKRYPKTRIQRLLLYTLLGITKEKRTYLYNNPYIKALAFDEKGRTILNSIKSKATLPIIKPHSKEKCNEMALFSSNLYYYISKQNRFLDLRKKVYYKRD